MTMPLRALALGAGVAGFFELGIWYEPARDLSGDFYDVLPLDETRVALVVGDVSGKGAPAALIAASLQASLQTRLSLDSNICRVLTAANTHLYERTAPHHFATLFLGIYDTTSQMLRFVNCGHNPPLLLRRDGALERLEATATIVGAFPSWECTSGVVRLASDDLLLAYTDGLTESRDAQQREFGDERVLQVLHTCHSAPLPRVIGRLATASHRFRGGQRQDDVTLIAARVTGCEATPQ